MAKKRKKTSRRRRRIGAVALNANSPLVKFGSIGAGYLLADKINEQLVKVTGTLDPKIVNGVLAAGGLYMLFMNKGKKSTVITVLSGIAAGVGAKGLLTEFGVITGFAQIPVVGQLPVVSGYGVPAMGINGVGNYNVPSSVVGMVPSEYDASGINSTDR